MGTGFWQRSRRQSRPVIWRGPQEAGTLLSRFRVPQGNEADQPGASKEDQAARSADSDGGHPSTSVFTGGPIWRSPSDK